ncbi:MAG: radical SAM protein, partial [Coriobacteriales bacterium]
MVGAAPLKVVLVGLNSPGYQSLALGYVRAYAQNDERLAGRVAFHTLDLDVGVDPWWVAFRVLGTQPDVVAVSVTCWNARAVYDLCRVVKHASPQTRVVLGGPEVTAIAESVLREHREVDAVVRGEGEETFAELLYAYVRGKSALRVEGVSGRDESGMPVSAPDRALIADLDSIPSPYLTGIMAPTEYTAYIETYRGCPHRCSYCFEGKGYGRIREFSPRRVAAEVAALASAPGVDAFSFIDPVFNLTDERLEWLTAIMEPYAARGVVLHTIEVDIERIDSKAAALLAKAGVVSVETGPQTVGPRALETCRRAFRRDRFISGVEALKQQGIRVECDLIIGLPGDQLSDFDEGLDFC